eukprot:scaffold1000_cov166-Amphora_coffeaeformis.AAC.22
MKPSLASQTNSAPPPRKNEEDDEDCIVWGESRTEKSRKAVDDSSSPTCETPKSDEETPHQRQRRLSSLQHIATRVVPSSSEVKKREKQTEQQIDLLWSRMEGEDPANSVMAKNSLKASSHTPLRGNRAPPSTMSVMSAPQENRWGLVKSRRRRGGKGRSLPSLVSSTATNITNSTTSSKRRMSAGGNDPFLDLLEHLKTPDREETMPPPNKTRKSLYSLPNLQSTNDFPADSSDQLADKASPDPFGPFPDIDFEELDRSIVMTQSNLSQKMADTRVAETSLSTSTAPLNQLAVPAAQWQGAQIQSSQRRQADPSTLNSHSVGKGTNHPHPLVSNTTSVSQDSTAHPLNAVNTNFEEEEEDPFGEFPPIDVEMIEKKIEEVKQVKDKPPEFAQDENDPFGDFPDLDFEAIDQQIAAITPQTPGDDTLSRYRVVQVTVDYDTFSKTLHVARWKNEMYAEFEESVAIHREQGGAFPNPKTWPVDGLLHLKGEWYYTEVQPGDFLHIYSIFGRSSTSYLPLTIDTSANSKDDLALIMHPESLLIPTTISETMKCTRRAVLKNRLGSSGTSQALLFGTLRHQFFEESLRKVDFSQEAIRERIEFIVREASEDIAACPGMSSQAAKTELYKVYPQVKEFIFKYTSLAQSNRLNLARVDGSSGQRSLFLRATDAHAIEESICSPEMGIKGNIDAVMQAAIASNPFDSPKDALVGIELKTGHSQRVDPSHMAQLALYNIMLQARYGSGENASSNQSRTASQTSILLYINAESLKIEPIHPSVNEIKSLLGQRNVIAVKQKQASELRGVEFQFQEDSSWPTVKILQPQPPPLPPIANTSMCDRCYMKRECTLYASLEIRCGEESPGVRVEPHLLKRYTEHLTSDELDYFVTWDRLIDYEASAMVRPVAMKWLQSSAEQEAATGRTVSALVIKNTERIADSMNSKGKFMLVTLERLPSSVQQTSLCSLGLGDGCHAIISVDDATAGTLKRSRRPRMQLARGIVHQSTEDELVLRVSESDVERIRRNVTGTKDDETTTFRLDRDEVATGLGTLRRNVVDFITGDKSEDVLESPMSRRLPKLRETILRLREPVYCATMDYKMFDVPKSKSVPNVPGLDLFEMAIEFTDMNTDQRRAIEKAMKAKDYTLIQGLPGTGKTSTISFLVRLLVAHGKRVLVTSYTHSAVDNLLLKLINSGIDEKQEGGARAVLRIGDATRCHEGVKHLLTASVANEKEGGNADGRASAESIRHCVRMARVIGVTALSIPSSSLLAEQSFDVVIVDEAGQISQPAIIGALVAADSFILVGDHMQLPPLVNSQLAEKGGFGVSMLKRLAEAHPNHVVQLTHQYRMAEDICQLSNDIVYHGKLKCANDTVRRQQLDLRGYPGSVAPGMFSRVLDPSKTVVFLDTDQNKHESQEIVKLESNADRQEGGSLVNRTEATLIERIVQSLLSCGVDPNSIGIICPFNAQLRLLESYSELVKLKSQGLECSTIDRYQGRDKPVIIISFVRSNTKGKVGRILSDFRRLNVAVSRAERKLIMVGSLSTLYTGSEELRPALERLKATGKVVQVSD